MSSYKSLCPEKVAIIYIPLFAGVKVRCCVDSRPLSFLVHIYDGRNKRFRTRRFTANFLAGIDEYTSLLDSLNKADSSLQSFAISYILASTAIESLSAKSIVELYNSYSPICKGR